MGGRKEVREVGGERREERKEGEIKSEWEGERPGCVLIPPVRRLLI